MCIAVPQGHYLKKSLKFLKHAPLSEIAHPGVSIFITPYILHYFNLEERKCQTLAIRFSIKQQVHDVNIRAFLIAFSGSGKRGERSPLIVLLLVNSACFVLSEALIGV